MTWLTKSPRGTAYALIFLCGLLAALLLGKDLNSDQLNYHLHAGYSVAEGRFAKDFFASGAQSYLNPYSFLPFYLMVEGGLAPRLIVASLALFHLLNLLLVFEIAVLLNRRSEGHVAWSAVGLSLLLAFANPIFLTELGSSFNDITTSVPVLAGWYLLVRQFDRPGAAPLALAGALIGVGVALKLTNLFFSVSALPLLLLAPATSMERARKLLGFVLGGVLGAVLAGGWWAWQLWESFGNPFFPLFNQIFHSPYYSDGVMKHYRFMPDSLGGMLLKPFAMVHPSMGQHTETVAPDLRFAALFVLLPLFGVLIGVRKARADVARAAPLPQFSRQRALFALACSVTLAWMLWVPSSGNGRYFLPMSLLASVVLGSLMFRFASGWRFAAYGGAALVLAQAVLLVGAGSPRWSPVAWGEQWYELDLPASLKQEPALYLQLHAQSGSFLMPFLARKSALMTISGAYILEGSDKSRALLDRHAGNIMVLRRAGNLDPVLMNVGLLRFGLQANMPSCQQIRLFRRGSPSGDATDRFFACKTRPLDWAPAQVADLVARRRDADAVFNRLELACPRQLQPRGLATETDGQNFWRTYGNTDIELRRYGSSGVITMHNMFTHQITRIDAGPGQAERLPALRPDCR